MLSITLFLIFLAALVGGVWFAVAEEGGTTPAPKPTRFGAIRRALRRPSPQILKPRRPVKSKGDDRAGTAISGVATGESQPPPTP